MIYIYINQQILNCSIRKFTKSKLQYTYGLKIKEEDMIDLEEICYMKRLRKIKRVWTLETKQQKKKMKTKILKMILRCQKVFFADQKRLGLIELLIYKIDYWIPRLIVTLRNNYLLLKSPSYLLVSA